MCPRPSRVTVRGSSRSSVSGHSKGEEAVPESCAGRRPEQCPQVRLELHAGVKHGAGGGGAQDLPACGAAAVGVEWEGRKKKGTLV